MEHKYGHGKKNLANVLALMNLLAFTFHSLANMIDAAYKKAQGLLSTRRDFFSEIRTLTKYMIFDSLEHLFQTIIDSFRPEAILKYEKKLLKT